MSRAVHIAIASDTAYLPWCAVAMLSAVQASPDSPVHFHLVHQGDVSAADIRRLAAMLEPHAGVVEPTVVDPGLLAAFPANEVAGGGRISWTRLLLAGLLPGLERVIHLDADVLVRAPLAELWGTDLRGRALGAVSNVTSPTMRPHLEALGFADPATYFNAGVLLLDLTRLQDAPDRAHAILAERGTALSWHDQDVLNLAYKGDWLALDPRWNAQNSFWSWPDWARPVLGAEAHERAIADPAIRHFEGPSLAKPWHYLCQDPYRSEYWRLLEQTPWPAQQLEERTPLTVAIGRLPRTWQLRAYVRAHRVLARSKHIRDRVRPKVAAIRWSPMRAATIRSRLLRRRVDEAPGPKPDPVGALGLADWQAAIVAECSPYSMTSPERLAATIDAVSHAVRVALPGDLAECGVWRGGSVLAMIRTLQHFGDRSRHVYLYDTFDGMTEPTDKDRSAAQGDARDEWRASREVGRRPWESFFGAHVFDLDSVREVVLATGYPPEQIHFVAGPVEQTIPATAADRLAVLRLDTDWYESTRHELEHLYPRLVPGGVLIIDDYGHWQGAREAVDEYFAGRPDAPLLARIDYTGRMAVKGNPAIPETR